MRRSKKIESYCGACFEVKSKCQCKHEPLCPLCENPKDICDCNEETFAKAIGFDMNEER